MENKKIRVAITHGDTNGIGYELILKVFAEPEMLELCTPIIYGSPKVATYHCKALGLNTNFSIINNAKEARDGRLNLLACIEEEVKVEFGQPTEESGQAAIKALDRAMTDFREKLFDTLVCLPVENSVINVGGFAFNGLSQYLNTCVGEGNKCVPLYLNQYMRVSVLADNTNLKNVTEAITKENFNNTIKKLINTLRRDFRTELPRIAVLSLNSDNNGKEEQEVLLPAIKEMADEGTGAFGPYKAEEFFQKGMADKFDAILAMYHDQGIIPLHTLGDSENICYLAGIPLVCCAPDVTPEFDIAGKGLANEASLRNAIFASIDIFRNRQTFDEPYANPLPKLYHERKDEGNHPRFPKKKDVEKKDAPNSDATNSDNSAEQKENAE